MGEGNAREIELKLRAGLDDLDRLRDSDVLQARLLQPPTRDVLINTYFDDTDRTLAGRGAALRVRRIGRRRWQTLKGPSARTGAAADRAEWELRLRTNQPVLAAFVDLAARELLADIDEAQLLPVFETRFTREQLVVVWPPGGSNGATAGAGNEPARIAVAFDRGRITAGDRHAELAEVELELLAGPRRALYELAAALRAVAPIALDAQNKAARGWQLATGQSPAWYKAGRVAVDPGMTVERALQATLHHTLGHWLANEAAAIDGRDPEGVHQLRVALRRFRSALALFLDAIGEATRTEIEDRLKGLLAILGPPRDLDVLNGELLAPLRDDEQLAAELAPLEAAVATRRAETYAVLADALRRQEYADVVLDLALWVETAGWRTNADAERLAVLDGSIDAFAVRALTHRRRVVRKRGKGFAGLDHQQRHRLRIAVKKLRYGIDFFAGLLPSKPVRKLSRRLARLQEGLGTANDVTVARRLTRELAQSAAPEQAREIAYAAGLVTGWYTERAAIAEAGLGKLWKAVRKAEPFWQSG